MKQTCVFVLGMHRSGTSALGGVLEIAGVSMGNKQLPAHECNPKGFFENEDIMIFHDITLFPSLESFWDDLTPVKNFTTDITEDYSKKTIAAKIIDDYTGIDIFGIKDPRMCLLLPFWVKILSEKNIDMKFILPYRNPLEVALSLQKRDGSTIEKGLLLWVRHVLYAEYYSRSYDRIFTTYENLLHNPNKILKQIEKTLGIKFPISPDAVHKELDIFLEKELKHHELTLNDLPDNLPHFIADVATSYINLSHGNIADNSQIKEKFDHWRDEYDRYTKLFNHHDLSTELNQTKTQLEQTKAELGQSVIELEKTKTQLEQSVIELEKTKTQLNEIKATFVWRVAKRVQKILQIFRRSSISEK